METESTKKEQMELARIRFGLIAPMVQGTFPDESMSAYCHRVAAFPVKLPDGRQVQYKAKTLGKWLSLYNRGGMDALIPKTRCDKGASRVATQEAAMEIHRLRREYPRLNATQIHEQLVQDGILPAAVSVSSVQRYIRRNNLKGAVVSETKDRKAFEEAYFGGMWQANTCYLPYIRENRQSRRVYLIMILDDHSRMIVGGRLFYQENAVNFQQMLRDAVAAYGIPHKLYADNGAPYSNEQLSFICGSIGTVLLHTPVRDGAGKGKVERNFRTLKERWLYGIDVSNIRSLEEFNRMLSGSIRRHNTTVHSVTGQTPLERYLLINERVRKSKSREWLEESFHNRIIRRVNRDATVHFGSAVYDAPMQFIGQKMEVRFLPGALDSAYILYGEEHYPLRMTDRVANGRTKREKPVQIDYGKEALENVHCLSNGFSFNPFDKQCIKERDAFRSRDHGQMISRLDYLKNVRGIGVFTVCRGMGKTYALKCFMNGLNPNQYQTAYINLSTISVTEFYRPFFELLGLEPSGNKTQMFKAIQERVYYLYKEKKQPLILAVDEAPYLNYNILRDLKMLMKYRYDSLNCFSMVLVGEPYLNHILEKQVHETLRQRITVHYDYEGLSDKEVPEYIRHKMELAGGSSSILGVDAVSAVHGYSEGNPRKINNLMTDALTIRHSRISIR